MKKNILIIGSAFALLLGVAGLAAAQSNQQSNSATYNESPTYDCCGHFHEVYQDSVETYCNHPTEQNRQLMQQHQHAYEMMVLHRQDG